MNYLIIVFIIIYLLGIASHKMNVIEHPEDWFERLLIIFWPIIPLGEFCIIIYDKLKKYGIKR